MERRVTITTTTEHSLEEFWLLWGIRTNIATGKKEVTVEKEFSRKLTYEDVAQFLVEHQDNVDFVSVTNNFRLDPLPFD